MTSTVTALSVPDPGAAFETIALPRRELRPDDVRIDVAYAGICHSDIHTVRGEWGERQFPITPGHEIIGTVAEIGPDVTSVRVGDTVGVGCFVDSCGECAACKDGEEQFCERGVVSTYATTDYYGEYTQGGYSEGIVVRDHFVLRIPEGVDLPSTTPLLCAGITTYSPLKAHVVGPGTKVAVVGMGGLGHVAVKIAHALGAHVTVLSRTTSKEEDGRAFGADEYRATEDAAVFDELAGSFDFLLNTVGADLDLDAYLGLLGRGGTLVNVGAPSAPQKFSMFSLLTNRRSYAGSMVGGIAQTQEMLDFCAEHGITATIELIDAAEVDDYYDKVVDGHVRYRAVIDAKSLAATAA